MTTTETINTTPTPTTAKNGKGRKIAVIAGVGVSLLVGILIGKAGGGSTAVAAVTPEPVTITKTVQAPALAPVTVQAAAPAPVTAQAPAPAPVTVTVTAPPPAAAPAPAAPVETGPLSEITKSGTFVVGTDIKAGKWKTDGKIKTSSSVGYFAILNDPTGSTSDVDNIVTNDNVDGQAFATLEDGQGFENNNLHWVLVG